MAAAVGGESRKRKPHVIHTKAGRERRYPMPQSQPEPLWRYEDLARLIAACKRTGQKRPGHLAGYG